MLSASPDLHQQGEFFWAGFAAHPGWARAATAGASGGRSHQEKELFLGWPWRASPAGTSRDSEILVPPNKSLLLALSFKINPSSESLILNYYLTFIFSELNTAVDYSCYLMEA